MAVHGEMQELSNSRAITTPRPTGVKGERSFQKERGKWTSLKEAVTLGQGTESAQRGNWAEYLDFTVLLPSDLLPELSIVWTQLEACGQKNPIDVIYIDQAPWLQSRLEKDAEEKISGPVEEGHLRIGIGVVFLPRS